MKYSFGRFRFFALIFLLALWVGLGSMVAHAQNDKCYDPKTQKEIPCPSSGGENNKKCQKNNTCGQSDQATPTFTETSTETFTPSPTATPTATVTNTPEVTVTQTPALGGINLPKPDLSPEIDATLISTLVFTGLILLLMLIGLWRWFRRPLDLPAGGQAGQAGGDSLYSTFELMGHIQEDGSATGEARMYRNSELE